MDLGARRFAIIPLPRVSEQQASKQRADIPTYITCNRESKRQPTCRAPGGNSCRTYAYGLKGCDTAVRNQADLGLSSVPPDFPASSTNTQFFTIFRP